MFDADALPGDKPSRWSSSQTPVPHAAARQIEDLAACTHGWAGDGQGEPFRKEVIENALDIVRKSLHHGLSRMEIHPSNGGEVLVSVYTDRFALEVFVCRDGTVDIELDDRAEDREADSRSEGTPDATEPFLKKNEKGLSVALIRILQPIHYSAERKRYKSPAFSLGSDNSISVFDELCSIEEVWICLRPHRKVLPTLSGCRGVFWRFEVADWFDCPLPKACPEKGSTGDPCHMNLRCFSSRQSPKTAFKRAAKDFSGFYACSEDGPGRPLPLTPELLATIHSV